MNSLKIGNLLSDILNSWRKNSISSTNLHQEHTSYGPSTWPWWNRRFPKMAPGFPEPSRRRLKRHWRPALLALCVLAATSIGASFAMPKVEAPHRRQFGVGTGFLESTVDVICFFVGPRNKGSHHGFWVNCKCPKNVMSCFWCFWQRKFG